MIVSVSEKWSSHIFFVTCAVQPRAKGDHHRAAATSTSDWPPAVTSRKCVPIVTGGITLSGEVTPSSA